MMVYSALWERYRVGSTKIALVWLKFLRVALPFEVNLVVKATINPRVTGKFSVVPGFIIIRVVKEPFPF